MDRMFEDATNGQAYLKAGNFGLQGSGKTYTAALLCVGLHKMLVERGLYKPDKPVYMMDTEVGSSWIASRFKAENIPFKVWRTRAFERLLEAVDHVDKEQGILVIDSITAFWTELTSAYAAAKKGYNKSLTFQDWAKIKERWRQFTDAYINSKAHIVMCGRQGYEYDFFTDGDGRKQLEKTAIKMKGESETGYEPSLLFAMERHQELASDGTVNRVYRTAIVSRIAQT